MTHPVRFVSLCSDWVIHQAWFGPCAATWHRLLDGHDLLVMNDGGLSEAGRARIESLSGCRVERLDVSRQVERQFERSFPALALLRAKTPLMRKLTDLHFYFDADADILLFDSDIFVRRSVRLPPQLPDFAYCVDDVPGYTGRPGMALQQRLVRGLNSGFVVVKMAAIDLRFLETVAARYLDRFQRLWWVEQTCWALTGGRLASARVFPSDSVAIVSGVAHRDTRMRRTDRTRYLPLRHPACSEADVRQRIADADVVHFAGPGKPWISIADTDAAGPARELRFKDAPAMGVGEKSRLFVRLLTQDWVGR